jgi:hypothetical protein
LKRQNNILLYLGRTLEALVKDKHTDLSQLISLDFKSQEEKGSWNELHCEVLHNLHSSPNIRVVRKRMMRWAGHAARIGEIRKAF